MSNNKKLYYSFILILVTLFFISIYYAFRPTLRYAVFAGYNPNGIIEPYVVTYLKELNKHTDGIVYITDSPIQPEELKKLNNINILYHYHQRHNEYDWGSYKRGYNWLKTNGYLDNAYELIFANDSTYAPITSFSPMFKDMDKRQELDFWGNTQNTHFKPHLQSYFLVFRKKVINSHKFQQFIQSITKLPDHSLYILQYEVELTSYLSQLGYKYDSYIPYQKLAHLPIPDKNSYPLTLIKHHNNQFLKKRTFTEKLMILENIDDLLLYLKQNSPKTYLNILASKHPRLSHLKP